MARKRLIDPAEPAHYYHDGTAIPMAAIRRYARRIAERFAPEKIVLFGSHACGTPHVDSDVDLLVVMPAWDQHAKAVQIRRELPAPFAMDLIVRTPKNIGWRLADGESFHTEIVTKGKVLYKKKDARVGEEGRSRPSGGRTAGRRHPPVA
jgi:predicted nucleotidyltransferase